jgi:cardiolipin synthase
MMTPVMVILVIYRQFTSALIVFALAGVTDALDGFIARLLGQQSFAGRILDPLADKMLILSAFITLAIMGIVPAWLSVIVISRDVIILAGVAILFMFAGKVEINPSFISKMTTVTQLLSLFFTLASLIFPSICWLKKPFFVAAAILTVVSGLHYIFWGYRALVEVNSIGEA